jgi:zinc protease
MTFLKHTRTCASTIVSIIISGSFLLIACSQPTVKTAKTLKPLITRSPALKEASKTGLPNHYKEIQFDEFKYEPPHPGDYRVELDSNTILYLYPSKQLPIVKMDFYFEESNISESQKDFPVYSLLGANYKRGGTKNFTPQAIEDTLEFQSTQVNVSLDERTSSVHINTLKQHLPEAIDLMKEIVLEPRFDKARLEIYKEQISQAIEHKYDKPTSISRDLFTTVMKGSHPTTWSLTLDEVKGVETKTLEKFAQNNFSGQKLYIGISGDFDKEEMLKTLSEILTDWKTRDQLYTPIEDPVINKQAGIHLLDFPKGTQTQIRIAQPFLKRPHPDYYPTSLANYILGSGGFTSRLVAKVRTEHGLAYSVRSFAQSNYYRQGLTGVTLQTKVPSTTQALQLINQEIMRLMTEGPTDQELQAAKDGLIASLPSLFDKPESTVDAFIYSERRGRAVAHYVDYPQALAQVTREQVKEMVKKYFHPDNMIITLVGPKDQLYDAKVQTGPTLDSLGNVKIWTIEDLEKRY